MEKETRKQLAQDFVSGDGKLLHKIKTKFLAASYTSNSFGMDSN